MSADRVKMNYQEGSNYNSRIGDEASNAAALSKTQHGHTEALLGANKGALASQGGNASTAMANSYSATSNVHGANADNSQRFVKTTGQHEESSSHEQAGVARTAETQAMDLNSKVNRA